MDSAVSPGTALTDRSQGRSTVLSGRTLIAVRAAWLLITATAVGFFLASLPAFYRSTRDFTGAHQHAADALRVGLAQINFPIPWYAAVNVVHGHRAGRGLCRRWRGPLLAQVR